MAMLALTELLGEPVFDLGGSRCGRVRELALAPQEDHARIAVIIVRTKTGDRLLPFSSVTSVNGGIRAATSSAEWLLGESGEGLLLLSRDLLDQQVIDVFGRKVVRVNDVDLHHESVANRPVLKVGSVDVGPRGAVRRLLKGVVPLPALRALLRKIPPRTIPWDFVDLIETDPARRVKLKISHERLARLHPADIADIVENLAPDEREAVFETLDEGVAAEALEEVDPKVKKAIVESLDSDRAAEIVEEMEPDAAADLLADLPEVQTVRYESKEEAYRRFVQIFHNQPALWQNVSTNGPTRNGFGLFSTLSSGLPRSQARLSKSPNTWQAEHDASPLLEVLNASYAGTSDLHQLKREGKRLRGVVRQIQLAHPPRSG